MVIVSSRSEEEGRWSPGHNIIRPIRHEVHAFNIPSTPATPLPPCLLQAGRQGRWAQRSGGGQRNSWRQKSAAMIDGFITAATVYTQSRCSSPFSAHRLFGGRSSNGYAPCARMQQAAHITGIAVARRHALFRWRLNELIAPVVFLPAGLATCCFWRQKCLRAEKMFMRARHYAPTTLSRLIPN